MNQCVFSELQKVSPIAQDFSSMCHSTVLARPEEASELKSGKLYLVDIKLPIYYKDRMSNSSGNSKKEWGSVLPAKNQWLVAKRSIASIMICQMFSLNADCFVYVHRHRRLNGMCCDH